MTQGVTSWLARIAVTVILSTVAALVACAHGLRRLFGLETRRSESVESHRHVVMIGTFYNEGWFRSHVSPLSRCAGINRVTVICDEPLFEMAKVAYVCPPIWLKRIVGRTLARTITTFIFSLRFRPDVLLGYHIMPNALICLVTARVLGLKAVYQMTGGPIQISGGGIGSENSLLCRQIVPSRLREGLMFHLVRQFDGVVVRGTQAQQFVAKLGRESQVSIIPGSIDTSAFSPATEPRTYDLVAVGRLVEVKRYDRMLQIFAALVRQRPKLRIAIVGDGPLASSLQRQANELGISPNVAFLGQRNDVAAILQQSRVFILTSENEGLSIAMMEAMAAGLPVISSDVGEHRDLVQSGVTGLIIDPTQPMVAAEKIGSLLEQPAELERMGREARRAVIAVADVKSVADRWTQALQGLFRKTSNATTVPSDADNRGILATPSGISAPVIRRTAWAVFALAFVIRAAFCFGLVMAMGLPIGPNRPDFYNSTDGYIDIAENLADHGIYAFHPDSPPTTYRAPLYPVALAATYKLTGDMAKAVLWVNCFASSLTCVLVYLLTVLIMRRTISVWMMAPVILFPLSIYYCASSFSDTFVTFTTLLFVVAIVSLFMVPTLRRAALGGLSFAAAVLTKSTVLPIPVLLCAYAAFRRRQSLRPMLIATAIGFAVTGIWTFRNYQVSGHFIPVTGGTGYNTLIGNYMLGVGDDCNKSLAYGRTEAKKRVQADTGRNFSTDELRPTGFLDVPYEVDRLYMQSARKMFAESPLLLVKKMAVNTARFWYFSSSARKSLANGIMNIAVLICALIALPRIWRISPTGVEVVGIILSSIIILYAVIIVHSSRFCLPVVMPLLPMATLGVIDVWKKYGPNFKIVTAGRGSNRSVVKSGQVSEGSAAAWTLKLGSEK